MEKNNLIEKIKIAFEREKYPGDNNIVYNNSKDHFECNDLKNQFIGKKWNEITNDLLFENKDALPFFSKEGFKYYLPSFMIFILNDYYESDTLSDNLISLLTLPQEIDLVVMAKDINKFELDKKVPEFDFESFLYQQLETVDERVKSFITQVKLLNNEQSKLVLQFLEYVQTNFSNEYINNPIKPKTAINRYWFQFE
ncbi:hypothetical protein OIU80_00065 [Flavobacterium sp. LS1R47]|jgi:hypothetical protein|uniref:Uncharacterized protein n=1 Tax=Flavobacterium frigoritolerans TaxID=2987686 RepID=A0A9X2ZFY2_9FLAO|nr:DUF6714 family protein [Flavobacterium frigoritolerans]MCV9930661.1 hypothetical protein [Flavobacterium frigoritolerans]